MLDPARVVAVTSTVPLPGGDIAVQEVDEGQVTLVDAAPPKLNVASVVKPVPVTTAVVPPPGGPADGLTEVIEGAP